MKYRYIFGRLGKEISRIRKEKKLSQEELAFEAHVDRSSVALAEEGKNNPRLKTLLKISYVLKIRLSDILDKVNQ